MTPPQPNPDDAISELIERIRRGAYRDAGEDYPALKAGFTREEAHRRLTALMVEERIDEVNRAVNLKVSHLEGFAVALAYYADERIAELQQQLKKED